MALSGENIICFASSPWESPTWVNCQHLMSRLAADNRVLYVQPFSVRFPSASRSDISKLFSRLKGFIRGPLRASGGLWVFSPLMVPLHGSRLVRKMNRWLLSFSLRRIQQRLGMSSPILWMFLPTGVDLAGKFGEKLLVYHCVDEYAANPGADRAAIEEMERRLLERADIVITTSQGLYDKKSRYNAETHFLPNVADAGHFMKALDPVTQLPEDLSSVPAPRAGFIGALSGYKIDIGLLSNVAGRLPGISFVLVGPVGSGDPSTDISVLEKSENVFIMGKRSYAQLPSYVKGFDACLIPMNINETTENVFPMKFFEYLAAGKPVVSTALPALREYSSLCALADDEDSFVSAVKAAVIEDDESLREARIRAARENSWDRRIEDIGALVAERLDRD